MYQCVTNNHTFFHLWRKGYFGPKKRLLCASLRKFVIADHKVVILLDKIK